MQCLARASRTRDPLPFHIRPRDARANDCLQRRLCSAWMAVDDLFRPISTGVPTSL